MREFPYITLGRIALDIQQELRKKNPKAKAPSRPTLYRYEKQLGIYDPTRRTIGGWRIYSEEEAEVLKSAILSYWRKDKNEQG